MHKNPAYHQVESMASGAEIWGGLAPEQRVDMVNRYRSIRERDDTNCDQDVLNKVFAELEMPVKILTGRWTIWSRS